MVFAGSLDLKSEIWIMDFSSFLSVNDLIWYLGTHPPILFIIIGILFVISACMGKEGNGVLLFIYLSGIIYITVLGRDRIGRQAIMTPFWSYRYFMTELYFRRMILNNIFLFIPLGMILVRIRPRWTTALMPAFISAVIEVLQYITGRGFCELDDIFSNSLGGTIGFAIGIAWIFVVKALRDKADRMFP